MAFAGFDKNSGPSNPPKDPTPFGTFPSFPSSFPAIPNPNPNPNPSSDNKITFPVTQPPIQQQLTTPSSKRRGMPLDWEYRPKQSASISHISSPTTGKVDANVPLKPDNPNIAKRSRSFPLRPSREGDVLGFYTSQNANARRPAMLQSWHGQPMQPTNLSYVTHPRRLSPVAVSVTPHDVDANISIKRSRSPPLTYQGNDGLYSPSDADSGRPVMSHNWRNQLKQPTNFPYIASPEKMSPVTTSGIAHDALVNIATQTDQLNTAQSTWSPPLQSYEDDILGLYNPPNANARRLATSPTLSSHLKESVSLPSTSNQRASPVPTNGSTQDALANFRNKSVNLHVAKRTRSPPLLSHDDDFLDTYNHNSGSTKRNDASPSTMRAPRSPVIAADPCHQMNRVITAETLSPTFPANLSAPKRSPSPPLQPADVSSSSFSIQLDSEREMQAKAKRLARFCVELSQTLQIPQDLARHKISGNKHDQAVSDNHRNANGADEEALDTTDSVVLSDNEAMESSKVVVGKCTDMCPESEREERERKGDLDKFERLNGERNQTTKFLAIKKYNRTAEREANLIRPLPVLRETVDYLLNLLDRPYDENFLGVYNFLWDRMRAVRMDLRMQHIFNEEAILMLEQMIRLHIVAMHELCEYKKGEGFTEGFDAHLNIEQMNKTSVELFQMYEDHRKRGKSVPTEKEFRGYYALLKLDKHPGYKVEPSELSLDLAKMTSEMRCTPEILFARAVARSCRIGNFIAFFRLARKATYLQACLMHAHFAKLRTQALASLHSGLQNNQGIPVSHVVKWLGMEGEDVESLIEYHGFSLRRYEEPYVVKEGSFLNNDADYPTTRSRLVHHKKLRSIMDDVKSGPVILQVTAERKTESTVKKAEIRAIPSTRINEEMPKFKVDSISRAVTQPQLFKAPLPTLWNREYDHELTEASLSIWNTEKDREMTEASPEVATHPPENGSVSDREQHVVTVKDTLASGSAWPNQEGNLVQVTVPASPNLEFIVANPLPQMDVEDNLENEASILVHHKKDDETFREKLILILRKWKEKSSELRHMRERREFLANAALSSLTLGMPIRRQSGVSYATEDLNIDHVVRERHGKLGKSWARLNISELTQSILTTRNPDAKCISWKLLFLVQDNVTENQTYNSAMKWLHSKIMGSDMEADDDLLVSLPNLSIWKSWTDPAASETQVSCLAIIRKTRLGEDDVIDGSSCLLFLASGNVSWDVQSIQLHKLLVSIPSGANLPLLILITGSYEEPVDVINKLGLDEADKTKISSSSVIFLYGNSFFDDDLLKDGLRWLVSSSPLQPVLQSVDTRELILSCLRHSLSVLENRKCSDINPNHCILAFNEALDHSSEEIVAAASLNPNCWPSPEINLLKESSNVYLPSVGWSSPERIGPLISAIKGCKLPPFPSDMSMLNEGSSMIEELQNKKLAIEECLINYLTESTQLFNFDLAGKEANVMLQKGAGLELRGSSHYIVPKWLVIFRRIYNWQLMRLRGDRVSEAYILARKDETDASGCSDAVSTSEFSQNEVSFDELMEISCDVQFREEPVPQFKTQHAPSVPIDNKEEEDNDFTCNVSVVGDGGRDEERVSPPVSSKKDNKLDMLLERCNQLQDMIQTKLSIYF